MTELKIIMETSLVTFPMSVTICFLCKLYIYIYPATTHESIVNTTGGQILMKSVLYWEVIKVYNMIILKLHFKTI